MNLQKLKLGLISILFPCATNAYVYCDSYIEEIQPNKDTGVVWFVLSDGTKLRGEQENVGLDRNLSVALGAMMANKKVKVALNDGESCGTNAQENWTYIIPYKQ